MINLALEVAAHNVTGNYFALFNEVWKVQWTFFINDYSPEVTGKLSAFVTDGLDGPLKMSAEPKA